MRKMFENPEIELLRIQCESITDEGGDGEIGVSNWEGAED